MAGGVGSRFWPVSTSSFPKQFHDMLGTGETLIQKTFYRLAKIIPPENIFVLTNEDYNDIVLKQLPDLKQNQIVLEPAMRNTAPCILYAALKIKKINPNAVMVVAPSDHWIEDETAFRENLETSFDLCQKKEILMTLGIVPAFANTGYGYIEFEKNDANSVKKVINFREKPNKETAEEFLKSKNYLWNAGIFIWSATAIILAFKEFQPDIYKLFMSGFDSFNTDEEKLFLKENYHKSENISIDYAVMEKAKNVFVLLATFDWSDLGTWGSLYEKLLKDKNQNTTINAKIFSENSQNNIIRTENKKTVVIDGLNDYIIVDTDNVLLIYPKNKEQEIKIISGIVEKNKD